MEFNLNGFGNGPIAIIDDKIIMVVQSEYSISSAPTVEGWASSDDLGTVNSLPVSWSYQVYAWGPIYDTSDGWAYLPYAQDGSNAASSLFLWSSDNGETWSSPVAFPAASDGNTGLTEAALLEYDTGKYVAAIRGDELQENAWDGFYMSWSDDGVNWSTPVSLNDIGRQPHFYTINDVFVLTYRQYSPSESTNYAAFRTSTDGINWSSPVRIVEGVQDGPNIFKIDTTIVALNQKYPGKDFIRQVITYSFQ